MESPFDQIDSEADGSVVILLALASLTALALAALPGFAVRALVA